ncbi:hypothetical protein AVEN_18250-1 [Araneus ventricosus]|uniref:G-protein coupled receptors family 1 profile domain-containing protein n=1 Tax=Araneus ventricosus TaxID=182803 RepID=A0A4Y2AJC8_ARAVE|nr:hypothetical protein AVEN_18250-1 [Araneus ventricosus]
MAFHISLWVLFILPKILVTANVTDEINDTSTNTTIWPKNEWSGAVIQQVVTLSVIILVTLVGNTIIVLVLSLSRYRNRSSRVNIFILNLAIGDLAVCCITMTSELLFETALSRFVSGHLRSCSFSHGNKVFPVCAKCGVASASPEHILSCLRLSRETFETDPLLALDFLRRKDILLFATLNEELLSFSSQNGNSDPGQLQPYTRLTSCHALGDEVSDTPIPFRKTSLRCTSWSGPIHYRERDR